MSSGLMQIESRKRLLLAASAAERADLAQAWRGLERPAAAGRAVVDKLRSPLLWAGVGLVALKLPKRKLLRMPILLWKGYKIMRRVQSYLK